MKNFKKMLFLSLVLMAFGCCNKTIGQEVELYDKPQYNGDRPVSVIKKTKDYFPPYVISEKELPSYFVSGKIPQSFPKYDSKVSKEKNEILALEWADVSNNRLLLTEDAKRFVDEKIKEFKEKYK